MLSFPLRSGRKESHSKVDSFENKFGAFRGRDVREAENRVTAQQKQTRNDGVVRGLRHAIRSASKGHMMSRYIRSSLCSCVPFIIFQ